MMRTALIIYAETNYVITPDFHNVSDIPADSAESLIKGPVFRHILKIGYQYPAKPVLRYF
jgi:hypothetical protein